MSKSISIEKIVEGISELYVQPGEGSSWTTGLETIRTAALLDIARSLRSLLALARCPNVAQGYRAMDKARKILERMDRRRRKTPRGSR